MSDSNFLEGMTVVLDHLDAYVEGLGTSAQAAAREIGQLLANYAKANHPWQDRTSNTNNSIMGTDSGGAQEYAPGDGVIDIYLSAGMDYDIFLELAHEGKWAWLWPAIEANQGGMRQILVRHLGNARLEAKG